RVRTSGKRKAAFTSFKPRTGFEPRRRFQDFQSLGRPGWFTERAAVAGGQRAGISFAPGRRLSRRLQAGAGAVVVAPGSEFPRAAKISDRRRACRSAA